MKTLFKRFHKGRAIDEAVSRLVIPLDADDPIKRGRAVAGVRGSAGIIGVMFTYCRDPAGAAEYPVTLG